MLGSVSQHVRHGRPPLSLSKIGGPHNRLHQARLLQTGNHSGAVAQSNMRDGKAGTMGNVLAEALELAETKLKETVDNLARSDDPVQAQMLCLEALEAVRRARVELVRMSESTARPGNDQESSAIA